MPQTEAQTRDKILLAALGLFAERGIRRTSVGEVAFRAGVTRVTVYRYFSDRKELVRAAFLRVEQIFQKGLADLRKDPRADWQVVLRRIGEGLSALPSGDAAARADELRRLYPDVYDSIQQVRVATLNGFFAGAKRRGLLRPDLKQSVVEAVFSELVINFFDNPRFKSLGLSDSQLFYSMTDILLHGVLRTQTKGSRRQTSRR